MSTRIISGRNPGDGQSIDIEVEDGSIRSIKRSAREHELWLSPGLIDLQVNGYGGYDLNAETLTAKTVIMLAHKLSALGTTTFLPTLITATQERLISALGAIAQARASSNLARHMIPCVHLEGPHISPDDGFRGAHSLSDIRKPDIAEFHRWQTACDGRVGMVTLSPHFDNSVDYIRTLVSHGVHVAIGHTSATHLQLVAAIEAGAKLSTHLGNGIASTLPRHPNAIWTQLADERLTATLIADGHHLPAETLKVIVRAKGTANCILVSDSVALAGMPPGEYTTAVGGRVILSPVGSLTLKNSLLLAGAVYPLRDTVLKAMRMCEISMADTFRMVTENPGRLVGRGQLRAGADADLIQFAIHSDSTTLDLRMVMVQGQQRL